VVDPNGLVENLKKSVKGMADSPRAILNSSIKSDW